MQYIFSLYTTNNRPHAQHKAQLMLFTGIVNICRENHTQYQNMLFAEMRCVSMSHRVTPGVT